MADSTSVAKNSRNNKKAEIRPFQTMAERLQQLAELNGEEYRVDIMRDTVDRMIAADTPEAIFEAMENNAGSLKDAEELLNKPIALDFESLVWIKSAEQYRENNMGVFMVCKGIFDDGEEATVTTGAPMVVTALARLQEMYAQKDLPNGYRVMFKQKQTSRGYNLLLVTKAV